MVRYTMDKIVALSKACFTEGNAYLNLAKNLLVELRSPSTESTIFLLNGHSIKLPLNSSLCTHGLVLLSGLRDFCAVESSSCRNSQLVKAQTINAYEVLSCRWVIHVIISPLELRVY